MFDFIADMSIDKNIFMFIILLVLVSALAFFHTVFLSAFKKQIKPKWLLWAIYGTIGSVLFFINPAFTVAWIIFLFVSLFVIFLLVAIFSIGTNIVQEVKRLYNKQEPLYKKIFSVLATILLIWLFFSSGPFFFFGVFVFIIIANIVGGKKNKYLKFQAILPTAKIRSMAMGLVEVEGTVKVVDKLLTPIKSKECIGYHYTIESVKTDKEGNKHYTTIHDEIKCNTFIIQDETGSVEVIPEKLDFVMFPVDEQYTSRSRRHTQYILNDGDKMLLIGKANLMNDVAVITHEDIKNVFGISPVVRVSNWNKFKPLRSKLLVYGVFFAFLVGIIMILSISEADGNIIIRLPENIFSWDF